MATNRETVPDHIQAPDGLELRDSLVDDYRIGKLLVLVPVLL